MTDRGILIFEVEGKTIRTMRVLIAGTSGGTELAIDFTDGTSFSSSTCPRTEFSAELYIGGSGELQILKRFGTD